MTAQTDSQTEDEAQLADTGPLTVTLTSIQLADGSTVQPPRTGVVLVVGPNNCGKSQFLKEVHAHLAAEAKNLRVVADVSFELDGSPDLLVEHLTRAGRVEGDRIRITTNSMSPINTVPRSWAQGRLGSLAHVIVLHLRTANRLTLVQQVDNVDPRTTTRTNSLQRLFERFDVEAELCQLTRDVFGAGVTLDRHAGKKLRLLSGEVPAHLTEGRKVPNSELLDFMKRMTPLYEEGDGLKSFVGVLLEIVLNDARLALIDEPEAFLHPPQARKLGEYLGKLAKDDRQVVIATHSRDVLEGVSDSGAAVSVVRLKRDGSSTSAAVLDPAGVKSAWSDPILRHSNILEALFHKQTVLCEADMDCSFYRLTAEHLGGDASQIHFIHGGGKDRAPVIIQALSALEVVPIVIQDLDALRDKPVLKKTIEALGGEWTSANERDWKILDAQLRASTKTVDPQEVLKAVTDLVTGQDELTKASSDAIRDAAKLPKPWSDLKKRGTAAIPAGDATAAANRLLDHLSSHGLHLVPVGEVEGWHRDVGNHGPKWLSSVVEQEKHTDPPTSLVEFWQQATGVSV